MAAKGSPETIFDLCKLSEDEVTRYRKILNDFASKGIRVLGVAQGKLDNGLPEKQEDFQFEFAGLVGLEDPVRPEVPLAIQECKEAGIKVMMITGDYPETAKSIAAQAGITDQFVLTGDELAKLNDNDLKEKIKNITVCARVIPEQKLRIVNALKANGEIVAMTGDGVNDAPALKAADIGIAMGNKGTDVAREASSLVLLDDNFASIVAAIRSGRRIFDNLQKAMAFIIAVHIPIIGLTMLPAFSSHLPVLLLPLHIVFLELIIDPVCSVAFEFEQEEKGIMSRKPRRPEDKFFGINKIAGSILQGLYLLALVILIYFISIWEGHTEGEVRAIAFSTLVIGNIFLILTDLSKTRSFISIVTGKNPAALFILIGACVALIVGVYVPAMQKLFGFENPGFIHFIWSLAGLILMLSFFEIRKLIRQKNKN
ncbi:MAG: cation-translocating P-type ATPase [Crocinitomicaceae bacterium]|nr:cation-translocating P-type ATPase [Crocinitomicaceae bacterium]